VINTIIIDDDFDTVEVFSEFLELRGINVMGKAYGGLEGVQLYEKLKPDIVFSDIIMPENDGFFVLENIKKINPSASVIMVTADLSSDIENKVNQLNADGIIYKPFEMNTVINVINSINSKKSQNKLSMTKIT